MELSRTKIIIRFEKTVWSNGKRYSDSGDEPYLDSVGTLMPIAEEVAVVVREHLRIRFPPPDSRMRFVVRVKKGSHKAKEVFRGDV